MSCSCPLPPLPATETAERWRPETPRQSVQAPRPEYTDWIRLKKVKKVNSRCGRVKSITKGDFEISMLPVNILYKAAQECCNVDRTTRNIANVTYIHYFGNIVPSKAQGNKNVQKPEEFAPYLVFLCGRSRSLVQQFQLIDLSKEWCVLKWIINNYNRSCKQTYG